MLGVQARIFDSAFFEVSGGGLKDVEHRHMPCPPNAVILSRTDNASPARTDLGVQARIFDSAFFEVSGGGLKDVEHRHMPCPPNAVILSRTDNASPART